MSIEQTNTTRAGLEAWLRCRIIAGPSIGARLVHDARHGRPRERESHRTCFPGLSQLPRRLRIRRPEPLSVSVPRRRGGALKRSPTGLSSMMVEVAPIIRWIDARAPARIGDRDGQLVCLATAETTPEPHVEIALDHLLIHDRRLVATSTAS